MKLVSELLRQAQIISQTSNTDRLEWRDYIDKINAYYVNLYNDIHSNGDIYYSKEFFPDGRKCVLPSDFYTVLFVGYKLPNGTEQPILRNSNFNRGNGYTLINNTIEFSMTTYMNGVFVRYLPFPKTLTYPKESIVLKRGKSVGASYDSYKNKAIWFDRNIVTIYDVVENNTSTIELVDELGDPLFITNAIIDLDYYFILTEDSVLHIYKNDVLEQDVTDVIKISKIGQGKGITITYVDNSLQIYVNSVFTSTNKERFYYCNGFLYQENNRIMYETLDLTDDVSEFFTDENDVLLPYIISDYYFFVKQHDGHWIGYNAFNSYIFNVSRDEGRLTRGDLFSASTSDLTGFGVIHWDESTDNLYLSGFTPNTKLDFPENIFYTRLETQLALFLSTISGNSNMAAVAEIADQAENTFQKFISRDQYLPARINNVRSNRTWGLL